MSSHRKFLGVAAVALAVSGGAVAGALIGAPGTSGADDDGDSADDPSLIERHDPGPWPHGDTLTTAAEALGISEEELQEALRDGRSIADVAEDEGGDVDTVVDALVADATEQYEDAIDELPEEMEELVNREGFPEIHELPQGGHFGILGGGLDAAAEAIGIGEDDLREALQDGKTIAEVAEDNDVDIETVVEALAADATESIDRAVEDGDLDADQAEELKQDVTERITDFVNGEVPAPPDGPGPTRDRLPPFEHDFDRSEPDDPDPSSIVLG